LLFLITGLLLRLRGKAGLEVRLFGLSWDRVLAKTILLPLGFVALAAGFL